MADRVGVIGHGRLQQWTSAYNLYHRPANRFVAGFVGEGVLMPARVVDDGHVGTEFGVLAADHRLLDPPGTAVEMLLRPDDVIHDDDAPLQARIVRRHFRGADFLYTLQLDGGGLVQALVPSHHDHAIGQSIGIRLDLEHVVVFEQPENGLRNGLLQSA
jgi:iron(III) transport system ATP-binding protein